jgi:multidrug efflux pump subunit AcrA (membrane-fusion protein)
VATIDPTADVILGVVNYKATITLDQPVEGLLSSMTADLEILTENKSDVIVIPRRALIKSGTGSYQVKILQDEKVIERDVTVGLIGDSEAEVTNGLNGGEQVILKQS